MDDERLQGLGESPDELTVLSIKNILRLAREGAWKAELKLTDVREKHPDNEAVAKMLADVQAGRAQIIEADEINDQLLEEVNNGKAERSVRESKGTEEAEARRSGDQTGVIQFPDPRREGHPSTQSPR